MRVRKNMFTSLLAEYFFVKILVDFYSLDLRKNKGETKVSPLNLNNIITMLPS